MTRNQEDQIDTILILAGLFATATLLGSMAFFSAVMAPLIFTELDSEIAGRFIRRVFPWYYLTVIGLSILAVFCLVFSRVVDAALLGAVAALGILARQVLMPRINRARDSMLSGDRAPGLRFSRLHRLSVWINLAQMIAVAIVLARFV
ncbi:MAG: DUF4149 domain-containing protein [Candidatus Binatia bacterium]